MYRGSNATNLGRRSSVISKTQAPTGRQKRNSPAVVCENVEISRVRRKYSKSGAMLPTTNAVVDVYRDRKGRTAAGCASVNGIFD